MDDADDRETGTSAYEESPSGKGMKTPLEL
jgi:hypothetical protein